MKSEKTWQDPDYREPDVPQSNGIRRFVEGAALAVGWATLILLGLQVYGFAETGAALMRWWWVFSPIWISAGLFIIAFLIVAGILLSAVISDIKRS